MPPLVIPYPAIDPILIQIGPFALRWYALAYIMGILLGWMYARAIIRTERFWGGPAPMTVADYDDFVLWGTLGVILGGRIGYVLFYNPAHFAANPAEIVKLWTGGMSFHGGFAGVVLAVILFSRSRKIPFFSLADVTCAVYPIGHALGRIANFINGELWGRPTDVPWAMVFPDRVAGPIPRHPSQLYEAALEGVLLLVILAWAMNRGALKRPGLVTGIFAVAYGVTRIICELFREPDMQLGFLWGGLTMGMLLSVPLIALGFAFIAYALREPRRATEP
jgi:phosphatidylglycerol:prolipoprotein diacylglycerol transferase